MHGFFASDPDDDYGDDDCDVTCNRCKRSGLEWVNCGTAGWKLYEGRTLHKCPAAVATDADFD